MVIAICLFILVRDHVQYIQSMPVRPSVSVRQLCSFQLPWDRGEGGAAVLRATPNLSLFSFSLYKKIHFLNFNVYKRSAPVD